MMEKLLQKEFWLKVFSVAVAILLWVVVMQDYTTETTRTFSVPLQVVHHPIYVVNEGLENGETTVEVRVTDRNLVVSRLRSEDFHAVVDYSGAVLPGKPTVFEVSVVTSKRVNYTVLPKTVTATLVENRDIQVPVNVEPPSGTISFENRDWRWTANTPAKTATISGRSDYVVTVKQAVINLDPKELLPSVESLQKQITPLDAAGKPVEKLAITAMEVDLVWEALPPGKQVRIEPQTRGTLPKGYVVTKLDASPQHVTMRATTVNGALPNIDVLGASPIDLTGQTQSFTSAIRMVPPDGTTLSQETVNVAVTIAESTLEKTFKGAQIQVEGAEINVEATPAVTVAQVHVKGPYSLINSLEASAISAYVDVETLREGKHFLPVKVRHPPGITEAVVDPPSVEVNIVIR